MYSPKLPDVDYSALDFIAFLLTVVFMVTFYYVLGWRETFLKEGDWLSKKIFSCMFLPDVLCSFRKSERFGVMDRCLKCPHYFRFLREMEEEEDEFWEEVDKIRKYGYPRKFDVSEGGS